MLQEERRKWVQVAGANIEELLESGRVKEAWYQLARWYGQVRGIQPPLTRDGLEQVLAESTELYRCRPPEGLWVPLLVWPAELNDDIPLE